MMLWKLKYVIGIIFLSCHLFASMLIWFLLTPSKISDEEARTLFFIILPLTSFYTISFVKDTAKNQFVDVFYDSKPIAPQAGWLQISIVFVFSLAIIGILLHYYFWKYDFDELKTRFGIVDAIFTGIIGAISENLFGTIKSGQGAGSDQA